jgi:hypothetical protein
MKKMILALAALITMTVQASAMSYRQAREQALFLTDKMAYELNLTDEQYEAAYEINLDYLMGVNSYDDLYGIYWRQRNIDLSYILLDWQYNAYCAASYFYRPLYWDGGYWHFGIYARYPHRDYFFFDYPRVYVSYHGDHSWYRNGGRSWYRDRRFAGPDRGRGDRYFGMRDQFDRGSFGNGHRVNNLNRNFNNNNGNRSFGNGSRRIEGNTRSFGGGSRMVGANGASSNRRSFGGASAQTPNRSYGGGMQTPRRSVSRSTQNSRTRSFGNSERRSSTRTTVTRPNSSSRSFGGGHFSGSSPRRTFTPNNSGSSRSMGNMSRSFSAPSRSNSFGSSKPSTRSFGGGNSKSSSRPSGGHFGSRKL